MGHAPVIPFGRRRLGRAALCAVLIPLLVLSNLSVDVFVSHAHGGEPAHTHATRALGVDAYFLNRQIEHCHQHREAAPASPHDHPTHHGHGDETVIAAADCQTTVVVTAASTFVGRHQASPKQLLHHMLAAAVIDWPALHRPINTPLRPAPHHDDSPAPAFDVVRCTVRLI